MEIVTARTGKIIYKRNEDAHTKIVNYLHGLTHVIVNALHSSVGIIHHHIDILYTKRITKEDCYADICLRVSSTPAPLDTRRNKENGTHFPYLAGLVRGMINRNR